MILLNYFIKNFVNKILYIYMNIILYNDDLFKKYDFRICRNN